MPINRDALERNLRRAMMERREMSVASANIEGGRMPRKEFGSLSARRPNSVVKILLSHAYDVITHASFVQWKDCFSDFFLDDAINHLDP